MYLLNRFNLPAERARLPDDPQLDIALGTPRTVSETSARGISKSDLLAILPP
jgi:hypothetical protein